MMENNIIFVDIVQNTTDYIPLPTYFVPFERKPDHFPLLRDVYYNFRQKFDTQDFFEKIQTDFPSLSDFYFLVEIIFLAHQRTKEKFNSTLNLVNFCPRHSNIARFANNLIPVEASQVLLSLYPAYEDGARKIYYIQDYEDLLLSSNQNAKELCDASMKANKVFQIIKKELIFMNIFTTFVN